MGELWIAAALMLVLEGLLPFISPAATRQTLISVAQMSDRQLRVGGLVCMVLGAMLLQWLRSDS